MGNVQTKPFLKSWIIKKQRCSLIFFPLLLNIETNFIVFFFLQIKWTSFVNRILKDVAVLYDANDRVVVKNMKYFLRLSQLLEETPK